ncbi:uncharacterized protein LOC135834792 [Planococcus citri]|uniref:uncharacterized protein LOC135834792 n=1 Tax=Planococcus citri TaxID=170843 RepID=UPI0031F84357
MRFTFVIILSMVSINFALGARPRYGRVSYPKESDSEQETNRSNETTNFPKCIKKSELEEFVRYKQLFEVKNTIDQFETHWGLYFVPDWNQLNRINSPTHQDYEIRRQKWSYIFTHFGDYPVVKRLNSELQKAGFTQTTFVEEIVETYMMISYGHGPPILDEKSNDLVVKNESQVVADPLQRKCVQVFMSCVSDSKLKCDENERKVQVPESLYNELIRNNAHVAVVKQYYEDRLKRLKHLCTKKIEECKNEESSYRRERMDSNINSSDY